MDSNESLNSEIQQAYFKGYQDGIRATENANERLIESQNERIQDLKERIQDLKDQINDLRKLINTEQKVSYYNQYNYQSPGGKMSNPSQTHSSSGDNVAGDKNNNTYDFKGATFGGGFAGRDYTGDVIHNDSSSELQETVKEIKALIQELSKNKTINNTSDRLKIAVTVVEKIENNPHWKQKAINASKQGLLEAMKSNPIGAFVAVAIEGWQS